jgi:hypothetical protein
MAKFYTRQLRELLETAPQRQAERPNTCISLNYAGCLIAAAVEIPRVKSDNAPDLLSAD